MRARNHLQAICGLCMAAVWVTASLGVSACGKEPGQGLSDTGEPERASVVANAGGDEPAEGNSKSIPIELICDANDEGYLIGLSERSVLLALTSDSGWASGQERISYGSGAVGGDLRWGIIHAASCDSNYILLSDNRSGAGRITDVMRIRNESLRPGQSFDHVSCRDEQGYTGYLALVKTRSDGGEQSEQREVIKAWRVGSDNGKFIDVPGQELKGITCPGESPDDP